MSDRTSTTSQHAGEGSADSGGVPAEGAASVALAPHAGEVAVARGFVRDEVRRRGAQCTEDAELLTSEAVGNAVAHAVTAGITVTVADVGPMVRIWVQDDDPKPPVLVEPDPVVPGGHGMNLINELASEWGVVEIDGDGKRLWFDLDRSSSPPA